MDGTDFIRWLRDKVMDNPEAAGYTLVIDFDAAAGREVDVPAEVSTFIVDHDLGQIILYATRPPADEYDGEFEELPEGN